MKKIFILLTFILFFTAFARADVEFDVKLYKFSGTYPINGTSHGETEVDEISWNLGSSDITYGLSSPQYKVSDVYAVIKATCTANTAANVYVYTDNRNNISVGSYVYKVTASRTEYEENVQRAKYNGLVRAGSGGGEYGYAPMLYKVYTTQPDYALPTTLPSYTDFVTISDNVPSATYGTRLLLDVSDDNFSTKKILYAKIVSYWGIWCGFDGSAPYQGSCWIPKQYDAVVFFCAAFSNVVSNDHFGTNTINFVYEVDN